MTTPIRCNHARLRDPHDPHTWEPQPGMDPIPCPGYGVEERKPMPDRRLQEAFVNEAARQAMNLVTRAVGKLESVSRTTGERKFESVVEDLRRVEKLIKDVDQGTEEKTTFPYWAVESEVRGVVVSVQVKPSMRVCEIGPTLDDALFCARRSMVDMGFIEQDQQVLFVAEGDG